MFEDLEDWSPIVALDDDGNPIIKIDVDGDLRIFPTQGSINEQFDIVREEINRLQQDVVDGTLGRTSALDAWSCIESTFDGIYFWATAKNIQDYYYNRGGKENENLTIDAIRQNASKPDSDTFTEIYFKSITNKPPYPMLVGATSSHDLHKYGITQLFKAGLLRFKNDEKNHNNQQENKLRENLYRLEQTKYNAQYNRPGFKYTSKYTGKSISVPRITSETAYLNIYEILRETLIELKAAITTSELKNAIPTPFDKKQIEAAQKQQQIKTHDRAKELFKKDFDAASSEEQLKTLNEMLTLIKDNEVLAEVAEKLMERL